MKAGTQWHGKAEVGLRRPAWGRVCLAPALVAREKHTLREPLRLEGLFVTADRPVLS